MPLYNMTRNQLMLLYSDTMLSMLTAKHSQKYEFGKLLAQLLLYQNAL